MNRTDKLEKLRLKNKQLVKDNAALRKTIAVLNRKISRWGRPTNEERLARIEERLGLQEQLPILTAPVAAAEKVKLIEQVCAKAGGYTADQIRSRHRNDALWLVRAHCWLMQYELLELRDIEIAGFYGRDRSGVYAALRSIRNRMDSEPKLKQRFDGVAELVKAELAKANGH